MGRTLTPNYEIYGECDMCHKEKRLVAIVPICVDCLEEWAKRISENAKKKGGKYGN